MLLMQRREYSFSDWLNGLDNVSPEFPLPGAAHEAENVVYRPDGVVRALREPVVNGPPLHFSCPLGEVGSSGFVATGGVFFEPSLRLPAWYDSLGGVSVLTDGVTVVVHTDLGFQTYPKTRPFVSLLPLPSGRLMGRVGVCIVRDGLPSTPVYTEEPAVSLVCRERDAVYTTFPDGSQFYLHTPPAGDGDVARTVVISSDPEGALLPDSVLQRWPILGQGPASLMTARLLLARGTDVILSEPFLYGVTTPTNFVRFPSVVRLVVGTHTGFFVGTDAGIFFVSGVGTEGQSVKSVAGDRVLSDSFVRVTEEDTGVPGTVAAWVTERGLMLGLDSGEVVRPNAKFLIVKSPEDGILSFDKSKSTFFYYRRL